MVGAVAARFLWVEGGSVEVCSSYSSVEAQAALISKTRLARRSAAPVAFGTPVAEIAVAAAAVGAQRDQT